MNEKEEIYTQKGFCRQKEEKSFFPIIFCCVLCKTEWVKKEVEKGAAGCELFTYELLPFFVSFGLSAFAFILFA